MKKKAFNKLYLSLQLKEQEILLITALVNEPVRITKIIKLAAKCGVSFTGLKQHGKFALIRNLENKKLISFDEKDGFSVSPAHTRYIFMLYGEKKDSNLQKYFKIIQEENESSLNRYNYSNPLTGGIRKKRKFLMALYTKDEKGFIRIMQDQKEFEKNEPMKIFINEFENQFNQELMEYIPDKYKKEALQFVYKNGWLLSSIKLKLEFIEYCLKYKNKLNLNSLVTTGYKDLAEYYFNIGETQKLKELIKEGNISPGYYEASYTFISGNINKANKLYLLENQRVLGKSKRQYIPPDMHGVYFCLTLLAKNELTGKLLHGTIAAGIKQDPNFFRLIKSYLAFTQGDAPQQINQLASFDIWSIRDSLFPLALFFLYTIDKKKVDNDCITQLSNILKNALKINHDWLVVQCYSVLVRIGKAKKIEKKKSTGIKKIVNNYFDITSLYKEPEEWERSFFLLDNIINSSKNGSAISHEAGQYNSERLAWLVDDSYNSLSFHPKLQKIDKNGIWSKGRPVALKRIMNMQIECMTSVDNRIAGCISEIRQTTYGNYYNIVYELDYDKAIPHFREHPYLFLESSPETPFELVKADIHLLVKKVNNFYNLSLSQNVEHVGTQLLRETASRYKFLEVKKKHLEIANALGEKNSLNIPGKVKKRLGSLVKNLSSIITIQSDLKDNTGEAGSKIMSIEADSKIHIHLLPVGDNIRAEFFVRPFKKEGPYFKPGFGGKSVLANINKQQIQANRNLEMEIMQAVNVHKRCPSFAIRGKYSEIFEFNTLEESLDALLEIRDLKDDVIIEWPEGKKLRIVKKYSLNDFYISVEKLGEWFEICGGIGVNEDLDEEKIIPLQKLLAMPAHSKFIELSNGEFAALTEKLKRKRDELATYFYISNGQIKINPLNAKVVDDILMEIEGYKSGKEWREQILRAENAENFSPVLPSTLRADLRNYQREGFFWLSRLANWGVGACLADDMGLGKTVQALAVILERAQNGPTLVIAPSSVCLNWIAEIEKFTPTLNKIFFADENRRKILGSLKSFDVVVCSYNLMMYEQDNLSKIQWTTIALDEAQFIKNYKAKRTIAAFNLKSDFRLITTGTPIENHLSEIWTLFSFLNPGFLGTQNEFTEKFIIPIEKEGDTQARNSLKKILSPFILRRLKVDVLEELPEKTEINYLIDLSKDEQAFYEALRRNSVKKIEELKERKGGRSHLQILAELTRLRRACCHSSLVTEKINIESSKIKQFLLIIDELKENKHKALVFSQFVGYLKILSKVCDSNNITYQYLDGSTPIRKRQERINAFQSGQGDIFLISLKAGGTGMNLTAADYVIHTDPWWNPAVEDQASDRAHRIGQKRPVTVYRLITKMTIEEKIIALHKKKRELANSILEGTDVTGKMSTKELLELI